MKRLFCLLILLSIFIKYDFSYSTEFKKPHITIIKDFHCDYKIQKLISKKISDILKVIDAPILTEGAYGIIDLAGIAHYSDKPAVIEVSDYLLKNGLINGSEYYAVINNKPDIIHGVDDRKLYRMSYKYFTQITGNREDTINTITIIKNRIEKIKKDYLSPENQKFDSLRNSFNNGSIGIYEYINGLLKTVNFKKYPALDLFIIKTNYLKSIVTAELKSDKNLFMKECETKLPAKIISELHNKETLLSLNKISVEDYWRYITNLSILYKIDLSKFKLFCKNIESQITLMSLTQDVDIEIDKLNKDLYARFSSSYYEKKLSELILFIEYVSNLIDFNIPSYKIKFYKSEIENFDYESAQILLNDKNENADFLKYLCELSSTADICCQFYNLSDKRDELMAENIVKFTKNNKTRELILICGAMHILNIKKLLIENGFDVSIENPAENNYIHPDNSIYIQRMMNQPFDFNNMIITPVYLAFASLFAKEPFLEKLAFSNLNLPIDRAVKIALITTSIKHIIRDMKTPKEKIASEIIQKVNIILQNTYDSTTPDEEKEVKLTSVNLSDSDELITFDCVFTNNLYSSQPQKIRVTLSQTSDFDLNQDFIIYPQLDNIRYMKHRFLNSLKGSKASFDDILEQAEHNHNFAKIIFGETFNLLNKVPPNYIELYHHITTSDNNTIATSPFKHTLDVAKNLNLLGIDKKYHRVLRLAALTHNMWKIYSASNKFTMKRKGELVEFKTIIKEKGAEKTTVTTDVVRGTPTQISSQLIPVILSDFGVNLQEWELSLLHKLVETSDLLGVIGYEWDEQKAKSEFEEASKELNMALFEFLQLSRRLYEADIVSIYTERLGNVGLNEVNELLDVTERINNILELPAMPAYPVVGEEKSIFFESLASYSPDFMRYITKAMHDKEYAEKIFPPTFLKLREIDINATPTIHRDPENGNHIDPFTHSLNAVNQLNVENIINIRALRIATMLHDVGKLKFTSYKDSGYNFHAEESEKMIDSIFEEWGIKNWLSNEEIILIKFLVKNHDAINRHTQISSGWNINTVIGAIAPPNELEAKGFDFFTMLKYIRRITQADVDSIPQAAGKVKCKELEHSIGMRYLRLHPELWEQMSKKHSPNLPIREPNGKPNEYALSLVVLRSQGMDNGYDFIDNSSNLSKNILPVKALPEKTLNQDGLRLFDESV